ncbi:MAG: PspA-associated protein PspAA [Actinomycetes bacterium]
MIVRILGEGQYAVDGEHADLLNALDSGLEQAVESGDETTFRSALADLLAQVRTLGVKLPDDALEPSDAVLPDEDTALDDVRSLLSESDEGLIPG